MITKPLLVVSYSISTSNHNFDFDDFRQGAVVSYSISTSNHNPLTLIQIPLSLYLIPFLHQTTTCYIVYYLCISCILFHFYIKPQPTCPFCPCRGSCILFHFYIKPQPTCPFCPCRGSCILFHFYIKPQPP